MRSYEEIMKSTKVLNASLEAKPKAIMALIIHDLVQLVYAASGDGSVQDKDVSDRLSELTAMVRDYGEAVGMEVMNAIEEGNGKETASGSNSTF
jgi:hypothetical protein